MITYENSPVGANLTDLANQFGAERIEHIDGAKFQAVRSDGKKLRMLADEGIGSVEGEDGFDEMWGGGKTFVESADSRQTSKELMEAIRFVAGSDEAAERVWADPTEAQMLAIWERATKNGLVDADEFVWGEAGSSWADNVRIDQFAIGEPSNNQMTVRYYIGAHEHGPDVATEADKSKLRTIKHTADVTMSRFSAGDENRVWRRDAILAHYGIEI